MMKNQEIAEVLFEEIKSAIYHPEIPLDIKELPEDFEKVGLGIEQLRVFLLENKKITIFDKIKKY